jgi:hypothetical protein
VKAGHHRLRCHRRHRSYFLCLAPENQAIPVEAAAIPLSDHLHVRLERVSAQGTVEAYSLYSGPPYRCSNLGLKTTSGQPFSMMSEKTD